MHYGYLLCNSYYLITGIAKKSSVRSLISSALNFRAYTDDADLRKLHDKWRRERELKSNFVKICFLSYGSLIALLVTPLYLAPLLGDGNYEQLFLIRLWKPYPVETLSTFLLVCSLQTITVASVDISMISVFCLYYFQICVCGHETDSLIRILNHLDDRSDWRNARA